MDEYGELWAENRAYTMTDAECNAITDAMWRQKQD